MLRVILISDQDLDPNLSNSRVLLLIPHPENTRYQERKTAVSVEKEKSHQRQMPASLYGWWRGEGVTLPRGTKGCHCQSLSPKQFPEVPEGSNRVPSALPSEENHRPIETWGSSAFGKRHMHSQLSQECHSSLGGEVHTQF